LIESLRNEKCYSAFEAILLDPDEPDFIKNTLFDWVHNDKNGGFGCFRQSNRSHVCWTSILYFNNKFFQSSTKVLRRQKLFLSAFERFGIDRKYIKDVFMHKICAFRYLWHVVNAKIIKSTKTRNLSDIVKGTTRPLRWILSFGMIKLFKQDPEVQDLESIDLIIEKDESIPDNSVWDYHNQTYVKRKEQ
jgi:hypothetical protein